MYAEGTVVPVEKSKIEVERIVSRYGAHQFGVMNEEGRATIMFSARGRQVRIDLPLPKLADKGIGTTSTGGRRSQTAGYAMLAAETRRRWRSLVLVLKAKLEAVESGITTFEEEFLAHVVMPDGQTVADHCMKPIADAYASGKMGRLFLPAASEP